jgi:hypothetical protein
MTKSMTLLPYGGHSVGQGTRSVKDWKIGPTHVMFQDIAWCSRNKRRPYLSWIWCSIHQVMKAGSNLGSDTNYCRTADGPFKPDP